MGIWTASVLRTVNFSPAWTELTAEANRFRLRAERSAIIRPHSKRSFPSLIALGEVFRCLLPKLSAKSEPGTDRQHRELLDPGIIWKGIRVSHGHFVLFERL